jgi:signal transduction histidine kinase
MDKGGRIVVEIDADEDNIIVDFSDTGPGIPRDMRAHIFEPFFTTKGVERGGYSTTHAGLGLAVCRGIVKEMGGDIEVHSREGRGANFRITLPINHAGK